MEPSRIGDGGWGGRGRRRGGAESLRLGVHHILPISLQPQTTGPGKMTAGAANCEINWTCDPRGRDQHPARGGECASVLTLAPWQRNSRAQRQRAGLWSVSSTWYLRTWRGLTWLVWHCSRACETCCPAVGSCLRGNILDLFTDPSCRADDECVDHDSIFRICFPGSDLSLVRPAVLVF